MTAADAITAAMTGPIQGAQMRPISPPRARPRATRWSPAEPPAPVGAAGEPAAHHAHQAGTASAAPATPSMTAARGRAAVS